MIQYYINESPEHKQFISKDYNYYFSKRTGQHMRWGKTLKDNPKYSPYGMEIADIEISTICHMGCKFCYKSNTKQGKNMSLSTFKKIFNKFPDTLTQIAFGIGDLDANKEMESIFKYCNDNGVVPNLTINGVGLSDAWAIRLANSCGAVAVSNYGNDLCYNAVRKLSELGIQTNIHQLVSKETYNKSMGLLDDMKTDDRLKKLNAVVFLSLKKKGRGKGYNILSNNRFGKMINKGIENNLPIGCDSCSANKFNRVTNNKFDMFVEPCESTLFSIYIDVNGIAYPCSFVAGEKTKALDMTKGINLTYDGITKENFRRMVWNSEMFQAFRKTLERKERDCPIFHT